MRYFVSVGFPPMLGLDMPWSLWDDNVKWALGLPNGTRPLFIIPDFFLLLLYALQGAHFHSRPLSSIWLEYSSTDTLDFTPKPRSKKNQIKFWVYRSFYWIPMLLTFLCGALTVNVLSLIFICLALHLINFGDAILIQRHQRKLLWTRIQWYCYGWFSIQCVYQWITHLLLPPTQNGQIQWLPDLIGVFSGSNGEYGRSAFNAEVVVALFLFGTVMMQQRLNESSGMFYVVRYVKWDASKAHHRALEFLDRQRQTIQGFCNFNAI